jgi:hypothetical protein
MYAAKETFRDIQITLDGSSLYACHLERCKLVYNGSLPVVLSGCSFVDCAWEFGGAASSTLQFLAALHKLGGDAAAVVDRTWTNIATLQAAQEPTQVVLPRRPAVKASPRSQH